MNLLRRPTLTQRPESSKDMAKLLGAMCTIRKADEMQARGMAVLEEIVGKYSDLAGLAEIVNQQKM